ncbi:hypothetical protein [Crocinitomix algicola]|uniref:hypothetical protein n=1 Tax=Crocinitomix algicola TaxID=1740263 RepID=UPI000830A192|nr:hypothetical protein [Crocinitomix algicola]
MKSNLLLIILVFSVASVFAQPDVYSITKMFSFYDVTNDYDTEQLLKEKDKLKENQVEKRVKIRYHKAKPIRTIEYFDKDGKVTKREFINLKKETSESVYEYDQEDRLKTVVYINSKGKEGRINYQYNAEGKLTEKSRVNIKGEYFGTTYQYNTEGKLTEHCIYQKTKEVPIKKLVYTYYPNGDKKTTVYYKKGKLKYSWKYDCKPEGELVGVKNKDQVTICVSEEFDELGNRVVWDRRFDEDGKLKKIKTVYNADSLVLNRQIYTENGTKIVYDEVFSYDEEGVLLGAETTSYDKKGNAYLSGRKVNTEEDGYVQERFDSKGKLTSYYSYKVNNEGLVQKMQRHSGRYRYTYLYNYDDGLKTSEVRIYRNSTYVDEIFYSFYE